MGNNSMLAAIRIRFSAAKEFLQKHRRFRAVLFGVACLVVIVSLASFMHPAHAADSASDVGGGLTISFWKRALSSIILDVASLFLRIALFFLTFIIELSAYNGYLDATAVNVGWVMVRDVTNMFFVVALLIIAFGTILGIEQYEWKKLLVKFVLSAILVNFSRLICGVLIDMSQIVMQTFVNGIAATAGGNLINMFNLDKITKLSANANAADISPGIFTASVAAVTFAGMVMMTLGIFIFMLVARVIRLWILIVLSPLAFVLSVIPLTEKYAGQWWTEMGDDLVTGPVLLFFIWLSFVSLGGGDVNTQIAQSAVANGIPPEQVVQSSGTAQADQIGSQTAGIGDAMGWNQLANFAIAVGMLFAGARVASTIGGSSGSALSKVTDFGKRVATIASGVAAGQWIHERGYHKTAAAGVGMAALKYTGLAKAGRMTKNWYERQKKSWEGMLYDTGMRPKQVWDEKEGRYKTVPGEFEQAPKRNIFARIAQRAAIAELASEKKLEKTEKQAEVRRDLARARIQAKPEGIFQGPGEDMDALDRIEQGMLEAEKARSADKTKEFGAIGRGIVTGAPRLQFKGGKWVQEPGESIASLRAKHQLNAQRNEEEIKKIESGALAAAAGTKEGKEAIEAKVAAELAVKGGEAELKAVQAEAKKEFVTGGPSMDQLDNMIAEAKKRGDIQEVNRLEARKAGKEGFEGAIISGRAAHTAEEAVTAREKAVERVYLEKEEHGIAELAEEAELAAAIARDEEAIKALEGKAKAAYATGAGRGVLAEQKVSELAAETAAAVVKGEEAKGRARALVGGGAEYAAARARAEIAGEEVQGREDTLHYDEIQRVLKESNDLIASEVDKDKAIQALTAIKKTLEEQARQLKMQGKADEYNAKAKEVMQKAEELRTARQTKISSLAEQGKLPAWQAARFQSERELSSQFYRGYRQDMLSRAAQLHIWDKEGVETPNNALQTIISGLESQFKDMTYDQLVSAMGRYRATMDQKRASGATPDFKDLAVGEILANVAHNGSWVDDAIPGITDEERARRKDQQRQTALNQLPIYSPRTGKYLDHGSAEYNQELDRITRAHSAAGQPNLSLSAAQDYGKIIGRLSDGTQDMIKKILLGTLSITPATKDQLTTKLRKDLPRVRDRGGVGIAIQNVTGLKDHNAMDYKHLVAMLETMTRLTNDSKRLIHDRIG